MLSLMRWAALSTAKLSQNITSDTPLIIYHYEMDGSHLLKWCHSKWRLTESVSSCLHLLSSDDEHTQHEEKLRLTRVFATLPLCVMFLLCFSFAIRILCFATIFWECYIDVKVLYTGVILMQWWWSHETPLLSVCTCWRARGRKCASMEVGARAAKLFFCSAAPLNLTSHLVKLFIVEKCNGLIVMPFAREKHF